MPASTRTLLEIKFLILNWQRKYSVSNEALIELFSRLATETVGNASYNKTVRDLHDMMVEKNMPS
jgi:hypothetical protein